MQINQDLVKLRESGSIASETVDYTFIAAYQVQGFSALPDGKPISLPIADDRVEATLVADPNAVLLPIDERQAIANVVLTGLITDASFEDSLRAILEERSKAFRIPWVYLALKINGQTQLTASEQSWQFRDLRVVVDGVDKSAVRSHCRPLVVAIANAVSLSIWDMSPHLVKVTDGVAIRRSNGEGVCSVSFSMGSPDAYVSRPVSDADLSAIANRADHLIQEPRLQTPSRLLVDSSIRKNDRLESFLLAWAALEVLIKKYTVGIEKGVWFLTMSDDLRKAAETIHKAFLCSNRREYVLGERVRAFCMIYGVERMELVAQAVNRIRKDFREPLYHEGQLNEAALPVRAVIDIVRELTLAVVDRND
jgi:hypothetical protein